MTFAEGTASFGEVVRRAGQVLSDLDALSAVVEESQDRLSPEERVALIALRHCLIGRATQIPSFTSPTALQGETGLVVEAPSSNGHGRVALGGALEADTAPAITPEPPKDEPVLVAPDPGLETAVNIEVSAPSAPEQEPAAVQEASAADDAELPVDDTISVPPTPSAETQSSKILNGRAITRFERAVLDRFNDSKKPLYRQDKATQIEVISDKDMVVNGKPQQFRVPVNGDPSLVMQVLNAALELSISREKASFTLHDILELLHLQKDPNGAAMQAIQRFLKTGVMARHGRTKDSSATLFGLPEFVRIVDLRPKEASSTESTTPFLAQAQVA